MRHDDTLDARVSTSRDPLELPSRWVVADRYEILGLLGSGGMGTVYRARDRELDEIVALKMLRKRLAMAPETLERFRREVKLARRVTHRNVARTFDIGEHAGAKFLTMELVPGEMLGARLLERGRLRVSEVVRIGIDLCAGLGAAHAASVLHRDLKPANVILARDDRAVITDFGIARVLRAGESKHSTGSVIGTPAYMAPEQLQGAADMDARVDVYALGVMLFELLAGELPWAELKPIQSALARLQQPPPDVRELRPSLTEDVAVLVKKCMAMRREERFASAEEVSLALVGLMNAPSSVPPALSSRPASTYVRTTIAVLPLVNLGERTDDHLAETLAEDLGDALDTVAELRVRPAPYAAGPFDDADPRSIGRACGVDAVIHGDLRREGDRVVVSLRLSTVEDGFQLWHGQFDRPLDELVAIGDAAAAAIAEMLTTLTPQRSTPTNPAAHDLYVRGRELFLRGWFDAKGEAVRILGEAHMLSPSDAKIAATYARALARRYTTGCHREDFMQIAKDISEKALLLDPRRAEARLALATIHLYRGEGVGGAAELRRAVAMSPQDPDVLEMVGRLRSEVGPLAVAAANLEEAFTREPRLVVARHTLARAWAMLGDRQRAEESLGPQPSDPDALVPYAITRLRLSLWWAERCPGPELVRACASLRPSERWIADMILAAAANNSLSAEHRAILEHAFSSSTAPTQSIAAFRAQVRAEVHVACGEIEAAVAAIRDADANGLLDVCWLEKCPLLRDLAGHPELDPVRRSTALRAARVRDALNRDPSLRPIRERRDDLTP
jgi:serine/threonine-protein kinase